RGGELGRRADSLRALGKRKARWAGKFLGGGAMPKKPSFTLRRRLRASPSQVFSAWTDPKKIVRWFGPRDTRQDSVVAEMDLRVGGRYRIGFSGNGGGGAAGGRR